MEHERPDLALTLALCAGYFLVLLDVTVVNVALPSIGAGLHASGPGLAWVVDAYSVPLASLLLASGAIGDSLGHRRVVVTGFLGFGAASAACALAPGTTVLIAGRALQGLCAALMLPGTLALLAAAAPDDHARARAVGLWAAVGGAALPAGPFLGGVLVEAAGWRTVFWLNVPVIIAAVMPVVRQATGASGRPPGTGERRRPAKGVDSAGADRAGVDWAGVDWAGVDWAGAAALVAMLGSAVTAVIQATASPRLSIAMAAVTVVACVVFWRIERAAARPLLRVPAPARRPLAAASAVAGLMNLCSLGALFLLTQVFQDARRLSPLAAGLLLLPAMLPLPLLGTTAGRLTSRIGPWRASALGLAVAAAGLAGVAASIGGPVYPALLPALALWGAGLGVLGPAVVTAALQATPGAPGTASGASNTARQAGGALGVAAFAALAGSASAGPFVQHTSWLLTGAAAAFTVAALSCLRRPAVADTTPGVPRPASHQRA
jgi:MFS transporter, DHA2 family, methylenomycin A resistance protein